MPSLCAGMPLLTMQYAPITKRRETLKSVAHRAYGRMPCVYIAARTRDIRALCPLSCPYLLPTHTHRSTDIQGGVQLKPENGSKLPPIPAAKLPQVSKADFDHASKSFHVALHAVDEYDQLALNIDSHATLWHKAGHYVMETRTAVKPGLSAGLNGAATEPVLKRRSVGGFMFG